MPLQPRHDGCAVIMRAVGGQGGDLCDQPAAVRAVWRFERPAGRQRILLCDGHAAELADEERLELV